MGEAVKFEVDRSDTTITTTFDGTSKAIHGYLREVRWHQGLNEPVEVELSMLVTKITEGDAAVQAEGRLTDAMRNPNHTLDALEWLTHRVAETTQAGRGWR